MDIDRITRAVLKIRAAKAELTRDYEARKAELEAQSETLEHVLLGHLTRNKTKRMATDTATVYTEEVMQVSCEDWPAYHGFLIEHRSLGGLEKRVGREFVKEYAEANDGDLPPGIVVRRERVVRVRVANTAS